MIQYLPFSLPIVSLKEKMYVDSREEKNDSAENFPYYYYYHTIICIAPYLNKYPIVLYMDKKHNNKILDKK